MVKIIVKKNGAYRVEAPTGDLELVDYEGKTMDLMGKTSFSLCRCGASASKPFCDGTYKRITFQDEEGV
jgi:CDGSH-type Zn-finger protein